MAVPKYRTSKSKKKMRRSHHHLTPTHTVICATTGLPKLPHGLSGSPQVAARDIINELSSMLAPYER